MLVSSISCSLLFYPQSLSMSKPPYSRFFSHTASSEPYTLSLHDALPISAAANPPSRPATGCRPAALNTSAASGGITRSEEHTSELQSRGHLVCRLLLEKKKRTTEMNYLKGKLTRPSPQTQTYR